MYRTVTPHQQEGMVRFIIMTLKLYYAQDFKKDITHDIMLVHKTSRKISPTILCMCEMDTPNNVLHLFRIRAPIAWANLF